MISVAGEVEFVGLWLSGGGLLRDYMNQAASFHGVPNTGGKYDQSP